MASISPDAEKVLSGVDEATRNQIVSQAPGDVLTSGEASRLLSTFQVSGNPYGQANVAAASNSPLGPLDYSDPLGLTSRIYNEQGVSEAQTAYLKAIGGLRDFDQASGAQQTALEGQTILGSVITGQQANQSRLRSDARVGLSSNADTLRDFYAAKKETADTLVSAAMERRNEMTQLIVNNPGAGVTYTDTPETAATKIAAFQKKSAKDQEKKSLKDLAMQAGLKTSGSAKTLRKRIAKAAKKDKDLANQMSQLDLKYKQAQISELGRKGSGGPSEKDILTANRNYVTNAFLNLPVGEKDKFVDPKAWKPLMTEWMNAGGDVMEFLDNFGSKINPNDLNSNNG